uniref:Sphingomyelin phosphodiesterase 2 n=1 Tax=Geotrypetes seraphini TaxID=260995 RepID=A0A6P8P2S5_GEOSA|nr:sphingomyelin phosphodiesterase 2 [Geotrypetes seraphini]XP_033775256.1 sphingomyelin phosphodiesterase 2 [Geotrypetes seraphini]
MATESALLLRVFNLNCWAIRYASKLREERIEMIGDFLSQEHYDIVLLQEIWSERDYINLKKKLSSNHPFSHLFKSGVIGSGLCVFSKYKILDTFLYNYSLNGYPYMIQHGDWFCGKSVGLFILNIRDMVFNVYVTHLHAEYSREKDRYLPHRVLQAWELGQFIRHTSKGADVSIMAGDMNMHPGDLGMRLLRELTGLHDAFVETEQFEGPQDGCTLLPNNCYCSQKELEPFPHGIRIDYILYKGLSKFRVKCKHLATTTGTAPGKSIPYSDHEAVMAVLVVRKQGQGESPPVKAEEFNPHLVDTVNEARTEMRVGLHTAESQRYSSGRMAMLGLLLLLLQAGMGLLSFLGSEMGHTFPKFSFYMLAFLAFAVLLVSAICYVFHTIEVRLLQGTEEQMRLAVQVLQDKLSSS